MASASSLANPFDEDDANDGGLADDAGDDSLARATVNLARLSRGGSSRSAAAGPA